MGLIGAESSGKTTLADALGIALPACVVPEELRSFVEREGRTPERSEQRALLQRQSAQEETAAAACTRPWLVADPAPLMTAVYSVAYFDDASLLSEGRDHALRYDVLVWCAPDIPWTPEPGMRDGVDHREAVDLLLTAHVVPDLVRAGAQVIRVTGSLEERLRTVLAWQHGQPAGST